MKREKCVRNGGGEESGQLARDRGNLFLCIRKKKKEERKKGKRGEKERRMNDREFSAADRRSETYILIIRAEECRFRSGRPPVPFELMA